MSSLGSSSQLPSSTHDSMSDGNRRSANFHPNIWGDLFLSCPKMNVDTTTQLHYEELKQEVGRMLKVPMDESSHKLCLIDTMKRLGVSYHFEREIEDALQNIHDHDYKDEESLETTSLRFRLLRENGFNVPCETFNKFKDDEGNFKMSLTSDVKGLLELYEASHLRVHGEHILEEALAFTTTHLDLAKTTSIEYPLSELVSHARKRPIRKGLPRWDIDCIDQLPAYMKLFYEALLDVYKEMEEAMTKEGKLYRVQYAKEAMKQLSQAYFVEAKWYHENYFPTMEEYMKIALVSAGYIMITITSFVGMGEIVTKYIFDWASNNPKIVKASSIVGRLMDDIVSHKFEQERGHVASAVECYMEQHGVSEEKACEELKKQVENAWKDINEELVIRPTTGVPMPVLTVILNLARVIDFLYKEGDGYTHVGKVTKAGITSLLIDPISI